MTTYTLSKLPNQGYGCTLDDGKYVFITSTKQEIYLYPDSDLIEPLDQYIVNLPIMSSLTIPQTEQNLLTGFVLNPTIVDNDVTLYTLTTSQTSSSNVDIGMGANYYEEDLTTNVKKYFAEAFKFDGSQFEMDGDRIVGLKQSFIDSLATDLTNIVNTSITTATLEADNATINDTLTALGIDVTGLLRAKGLDVGSDGLTIEDGQGHKHKLHLGN